MNTSCPRCGYRNVPNHICSAGRTAFGTYGTLHAGRRVATLTADERSTLRARFSDRDMLDRTPIMAGGTIIAWQRIVYIDGGTE